MKFETSGSLGRDKGMTLAGWLLLASLDTLLKERSELHDEPQHMVSDKADQLWRQIHRLEGYKCALEERI